MIARGCAGSAVGEPNTVTIEVANGIATNGNEGLPEQRLSKAQCHSERLVLTVLEHDLLSEHAVARN